MKIIRFLGGLGNQMFQYAMYKSLEKKTPDVKADLNGYKAYPLHNGFELENIFDIRLNKISSFTSDLYYIHNRKWIYRKLRRLLNLKRLYREEQQIFSFEPSFLTESKNTYYWGYWQNIQYFDGIEDELRKDFRFKNSLDPQNHKVLDNINYTDSVSIHVRRGDYLKDPLLGGLCDLSYYRRAIETIQNKITAPKFFIFSDDIQWCKENLNLEGAEFVSWNKGLSSYIDMQLMANCKHNIIANSSFSWWAAWLNSHHDKIVICPDRWVNEPDTEMLSPNNWLKL